jgi:hypothetical protein
LASVFSVPLARAFSMSWMASGFLFACINTATALSSALRIVRVGGKLLLRNLRGLIALAGLRVAGHENLVPARLGFVGQRLRFLDGGNRFGEFAQPVIVIAFESRRS